MNYINMYENKFDKDHVFDAFKIHEKKQDIHAKVKYKIKRDIITCLLLKSQY